MRHTCNAFGCNRRVSETRFMCESHWRSVPRYLKTLYYKYHVSGQELTKTPTAEFLRVVQRIQIVVKEKEKMNSENRLTQNKFDSF